MTKQYECCDPDTPRPLPVRGKPFREFIELNRQYTCSVWHCENKRSFASTLCQKHSNNVHIYKFPLGRRIKAEEVVYERSIVDHFWSINKGAEPFKQASQWLVDTVGLVARGKLDLHPAAAYPCKNWYAYLQVDGIDPEEYLKICLAIILADHRVKRDRIVFGLDNALRCCGKEFVMFPPKPIVERPKYKRGCDAPAVKHCGELIEAGLTSFFTAMISNLLILKRKIQARESSYLAPMNTEPLN